MANHKTNVALDVEDDETPGCDEAHEAGGESVVEAAPLASNIEVLPFGAVEDVDIHAHLECFFRNFRKNVVVEDVDLMTPDGAQDAVLKLRDAFNRINNQLRIVKSLRKMLEAQRAI